MITPNSRGKSLVVGSESHKSKSCYNQLNKVIHMTIKPSSQVQVQGEQYL